LIPGAEKLERMLSRVPLEFAVEDSWLQRLGGVRPLDRGFAFAKRAIDVSVAVGIAVALLPLLPLVALAIKLDSPGPILYSQQRVGLNGRLFRIYKFRTMRQDAERNGAVWATRQDARITRAGLFMRKTRLDELPQLWNLLRGDMALVGPRPERPEFTAMLAEQIPAYDLRHTVKPGLTGWAQVCYRYTSTVRDTRAKVEYDLYYVKHCSLRMDLAIMLRTVKVVVGMKGQ
jgi:exopolysaccharide biosynthesis polyprenyl glycosylphosphotransferase